MSDTVTWYFLNHDVDIVFYVMLTISILVWQGVHNKNIEPPFD